MHSRRQFCQDENSGAPNLTLAVEVTHIAHTQATLAVSQSNKPITSAHPLVIVSDWLTHLMTGFFEYPHTVLDMQKPARISRSQDLANSRTQIVLFLSTLQSRDLTCTDQLKTTSWDMKY